ncbi:unnamed protein product, partial [Vitis vinifera]
MAYQIPFGVVEHILTNLGSSAFQEIGSMYGVPKEITKLNGKLGTIKAVLLDAEEKQQQQSNRAVKDWVRRLRGVVYDADDLLDDYATHYLQRGGLARQVSDFFSSENQTTLTQLVYNDERVKHFEHKTWVCISDDSGDGLDVKLWVKKILKSMGSWALFSKFAFTEQEILKPEIVKIGEEIAKMCKGVPLVIKSLAMILQSKREPGQWLSIRNNKNLLSLGDENENVLGVLKLSYDNLSTHLRQCFTYCALFPKDYEIEKKSLLEKAENDHFTNTLRYKMHDLIHDLAQSIIGSEVLVLRNDVENISKEVRHVLPNAITRLKNLQTLKLKVCPNLKKLPKNIRQLINLRHLENERWSNLTHMPRGIGKLTLLQSYGGTEFPSWMMNDRLGSLLPDLIKIEISGCSRCKILPPFSQLPSLKSLKLDDMKEVMELKEGSLATPLFPSLESLELSGMPKLKELWRMDLLAEEGPSFAHLSKLHIHKCSGLASLHSSPSLSQLEIRNCHNLASLELPPSRCLSKLKIIKCPNLASFNVASLPRLEELSLCGVRAEVLRQLMFVSASSSLKSLHIRKIDGMISLPEEPLQCVSTLETLYIIFLKTKNFQSRPRSHRLNLDSPNLQSTNSTYVIFVMLQFTFTCYATCLNNLGRPRYDIPSRTNLQIEKAFWVRRPNL